MVVTGEKNGMDGEKIGDQTCDVIFDIEDTFLGSFASDKLGFVVIRLRLGALVGFATLAGTLVDGSAGESNGELRLVIEGKLSILFGLSILLVGDLVGFSVT
jgi:hypothetical protein